MSKVETLQADGGETKLRLTITEENKTQGEVKAFVTTPTCCVIFNSLFFSLRKFLQIITNILLLFCTFRSFPGLCDNITHFHCSLRRLDRAARVSQTEHIKTKTLLLSSPSSFFSRSSCPFSIRASASFTKAIIPPKGGDRISSMNSCKEDATALFNTKVNIPLQSVFNH